MAEQLTIAVRDALSIAMVAARRATCPQQLADACGQPFPVGPHATIAGGRTILGHGPSTWLVWQEDAPPDFAEALAASLNPIAAVVDQSGAYVVFRLTGTGARRVLQRGCSIDLDAAVFRAGSVATTLIAHIGVIVFQVTDQPSYDVAVCRSFAGSFGRWLNAASASL